MKKHTTDQIIRKLSEAEALSSEGKGTTAICQRRWRLLDLAQLPGDVSERYSRSLRWPHAFSPKRSTQTNAIDAHS